MELEAFNTQFHTCTSTGGGTMQGLYVCRKALHCWKGLKICGAGNLHRMSAYCILIDVQDLIRELYCGQEKIRVCCF